DPVRPGRGRAPRRTRRLGGERRRAARSARRGRRSPNGELVNGRRRGEKQTGKSEPLIVAEARRDDDRLRPEVIRDPGGDMSPPVSSDHWFRSEEPTRLGLIFELRRIALRFRVRPIRVVLLAALITAGISYKFLRKPRLYEADVVLALTEGSEISGKNGI